MRKIVQISLLIQLTILGYSYSQHPDNGYHLNIIIKNLDRETINTAKVTVTQLKSGTKQSIQYIEYPGCYIATSLELGRVLIKVENQGYDILEVHHDVVNPRGSVSITLGKTNSKYRMIDSNKYPLETNGEIVAFIVGDDTTSVAKIFKEPLEGVAVLKSGWYRYQFLFTSVGKTCFITPTKKQKQQSLLADLRELYPGKPIGPLLSTTEHDIILLNSCNIEFYDGINENEIERILTSVGAKRWETINGYSYSVTFSKNSGIELLKVAEKLSLMKEVRSVSNAVLNAYLSGINY